MTGSRLHFVGQLLSSDKKQKKPKLIKKLETHKLLDQMEVVQQEQKTNTKASETKFQDPKECERKNNKGETNGSATPLKTGLTTTTT